MGGVWCCGDVNLRQKSAIFSDSNFSNVSTDGVLFQPAKKHREKMPCFSVKNAVEKVAKIEKNLG